MDISSARPVNHHADQPGFAGVSGLFAGIAMLAAGGATARLAVALASVSAADRVVDIGCGPGSAVRAAARCGARVTGVDPAPIMLRLARSRSRDQPGITWVQRAAEDVPLPDRSATVVWSLATVHHWRDVTAGLAEVHRVLALGGRFLVIERHVHPGAAGLASHGWTDQQAESFAVKCRAAGFDDARVETRMAGRRTVKVVNAIRP
jgi:ubiquinone/menaquinone biosynthesis C-methylase UbiE